VVILHDLTLALRYATHALLMAEDGHALHGPATSPDSRAVLASAAHPDYQHQRRHARRADPRWKSP
jgi:ABC-type cobalamin/Fe3+-siderophores transport system ATPase subunit